MEEWLKKLEPIEQYEITKTVEISVTTLDQFVDKSGEDLPDFLKLDVEGSQLDILKGGGRTLDQVLGIELEVWFTRIYEDQPLFSDITDFLEEKGFELIDVARSNFSSEIPAFEPKVLKGHWCAQMPCFFVYLSATARS